MSTKKNIEKASKFMSLVLRHKPEEIGIHLDSSGWTSIQELVRKSNGILSDSLVHEVVVTSNKKRFAISDDGLEIRANQGHSVSIDLGLEPKQPPPRLFHGTASRFLDSIREKGLLPGQRQYVHLSLTKETALAVGQRHGKPVVLEVVTERMTQEGLLFFCSENGVWLTQSVPVYAIRFPPDIQG